MSENQERTSRREFVKRSSAAVTGATLGANLVGAPAIHATQNVNGKVRMGFIGVGNRGSQLLANFMKQKDVQVAALCDVYEPFLHRDRSKVDAGLLSDLGSRIPDMGEQFEGKVSLYRDFRKLLEQKDIDAVTVATPDHWHAVQTIMACEAGKDIYVEKPLSIALLEGRKMVEAAKRTNRIVQVGLHRRSSKLYRKAHELVQNNTIGKVTVARAYRVSNMYPHGIGQKKASSPPKGLDWDLWLGPRPERSYKDSISPYKFRWWNSYSSQMANWGVHYCDAIRWILEEEAPISISAHGGRFALKDDRTVPDTLQVTFELPSGVLLIFGQYEANGGRAIVEGELEFRGTLGNLYTGSEGNGYKVVPTSRGQFQEGEPPVEALEEQRLDGDLTEQHVRNFVDCVKSRKTPNCDLETGHRSTSFALLANIALATKSRIDWDAEKERATNNEQANELLSYEYRKPWTLG